MKWQPIYDVLLGYLFCTEVMSTSDELQLMLVNTLRKVDESHNFGRIYNSRLLLGSRGSGHCSDLSCPGCAPPQLPNGSHTSGVTAPH
jgi:hypothetical protein